MQHAAFVHLAHAALAQPGDDAIPLTDNDARLETAVIDPNDDSVPEPWLRGPEGGWA